MPINMIVVVAIAVLVLVVVAGFFAGWFTSGVGGMNLEQAFTKGCNQLRTIYNCNSDNIGDIKVQYQQSGESEPSPYDFGGICNLKLGTATKITNSNDADSPETCAKQCGCAI